MKKEFTQALLTEIELQRHYLSENISTIYFGGGTPSLLPAADIREILQKLAEAFEVDADAEITLEANPDDIQTDKLIEWKAAGINRLSIGIQSFFEEDLQWMNRAHNAEQAIDCINLAKDHGFHNLTIDLIYGTPTLTNERWQQNVQEAIGLQVPHLSCYALTVEPKTALHTFIQQKKVADVDVDKQAAQFELLVQMAQNAGYEHYEISNFAKPGFRSRHNSSYWQGKPYLGLGPSAHSFNKESRQWNVANNAMYINALNQNTLPFTIEQLSRVDQLNEYIMTALRTIEGINIKKVKENFGENQCEELLSLAKKHIANKTLLAFDDCLRLSPKGKFLADGIAADLFQHQPVQSTV